MTVEYNTNGDILLVTEQAASSGNSYMGGIMSVNYGSYLMELNPTPSGSYAY